MSFVNFCQLKNLHICFRIDIFVVKISYSEFTSVHAAEWNLK